MAEPEKSNAQVPEREALSDNQAGNLVPTCLQGRGGTLAPLPGSAALAVNVHSQRALTGEPGQADRIASVGAYAAEVLDGREKAMQWLRSPNRALNGVLPLDLLALGDSESAAAVEKILDRIRYGIYS